VRYWTSYQRKRLQKRSSIWIWWWGTYILGNYIWCRWRCTYGWYCYWDSNRM